MKRIGKRTREQAADICAIAASTFANERESLIFAQYLLGASDAAWTLAYDAIHVGARTEGLSVKEWAAEAEALLRTGWCPED